MSSTGVPDIATNWEELSGKNDWKRLLDPIDVNLRYALINYGERAAATQYALIYKSVHGCSSFSRFSEQDFFYRLGVDKSKVVGPYKYDVKKFIYARNHILDIDESTWIGYVAVAKDEATTLLGRRDIVVAWRGSMLRGEWYDDLNIVLEDAPLILGAGSTAKVHSGFYNLYTTSKDGSKCSSQSARDQVLAELKELVAQYGKEVSITVVGMSLGGALAILNATDIVSNGYNITADGKSIMVTAFAFGSPFVGNEDFQTAFNNLNDLHLLRINNTKDPVPGSLPNILAPDYKPVGVEVLVDTTKSEYLNDETKKKGVHNIDVYLHACAGSHGEGGDFKMEVPLDLALLNRSADALSEKHKYEDGHKYRIPVNWWYPAENKDMIQYEDGDFKLKPHFYVPKSIWD